MAKNMKKRRRALEKENRREEAALYDFIPTTFVLPRSSLPFLSLLSFSPPFLSLFFSACYLTYSHSYTHSFFHREYSMFVEEFKKTQGVWIMKPIGFPRYVYVLSDILTILYAYLSVFFCVNISF